MKWVDGSAYLGEWVRGIQHGYGKMIFQDGTVKEGYFDNNIYQGLVPTAALRMKEDQKHKSQKDLISTKHTARQSLMLDQ